MSTRDKQRSFAQLDGRAAEEVGGSDGEGEGVGVGGVIIQGPHRGEGAEALQRHLLRRRSDNLGRVSQEPQGNAMQDPERGKLDNIRAEAKERREVRDLRLKELVGDKLVDELSVAENKASHTIANAWHTTTAAAEAAEQRVRERTPTLTPDDVNAAATKEVDAQLNYMTKNNKDADTAVNEALKLPPPVAQVKIKEAIKLFTQVANFGKGGGKRKRVKRKVMTRKRKTGNKRRGRRTVGSRRTRCKAHRSKARHSRRRTRSAARRNRRRTRSAAPRKRNRGKNTRKRN